MKNVEVKLYGSCYTRLSLANSDIDFVITNGQFTTKKDIEDGLLQIANDLSYLKWVVSY